MTIDKFQPENVSRNLNETKMLDTICEYVQYIENVVPNDLTFIATRKKDSSLMCPLVQKCPQSIRGIERSQVNGSKKR